MTSTPPPPHEPQQPGPGGYPAYPGAGGDSVGSPGVGGYPTHPGTPAGGGGRPGGAEVPQPGSIRLAVRLMWAGATVSLVSLIIGLVTLGDAKDQIRDDLVKDDPNVSQSTIDAAFAIGIVVVVIFGSIGVLLWLWMAWKNGQGRPWARVVATVLGGLNLLLTLLSLTRPSAEAANLALSLVNVVLAIVILVLLWRRESNEFYTARSQPQWG